MCYSCNTPWGPNTKTKNENGSKTSEVSRILVKINVDALEQSSLLGDVQAMNRPGSASYKLVFVLFSLKSNLCQSYLTSTHLSF